MLWGPVADRFGRVRTLTLTILCYSLFTLPVRAGHQHLAARGVPAARRRSASAASGRWAARSSPRNGPRIVARRAPATCTPATTSASSSPRSPTTPSARATAGGWMFVVGGAAGAARHVHPLRRPRVGARGRTRVARRPADDGAAFAKMFSRRLRAQDHAQLRCTCSCRSSACGPGRSTCRRRSRARAARRLLGRRARRGWRPYGTMVLSLGTILGCLVLPPIGRALGRRLTLGIYFVVMFVTIVRRRSATSSICRQTALRAGSSPACSCSA